MLTNDKKVKLSPFNKINNYMTFFESDLVLDDFIDYCWFYGTWNSEKVLKFLRSDNGGSLIIDNKLVLTNLNGFSNFRAMVSVSIYWLPINILQLREIKIGGKIVLDCDLYWKGIKLIRENDLRTSLYKLFTYYLEMDEIKITRVDYTVDCIKQNFDKQNRLSCRVSWSISNKVDWVNQVKYKTFGRKWHDSAYFLRYYDKKHEIESRGTQYLYPEYSLLPSVMRYELQVNSKWLNKLESEITINQLYSFLTLQKEIPSPFGRHEKKRDQSIEEQVIAWIKKLVKMKDEDALDKIKFILNWYENYL